MPPLASRIWLHRLLPASMRTDALATLLRDVHQAQSTATSLSTELRSTIAEENHQIVEKLLAIARIQPDGNAIPALASAWLILQNHHRDELFTLVGDQWAELVDFITESPDALARQSVLLALAQRFEPTITQNTSSALPLSLAPILTRLLADADSKVGDLAEGLLERALATNVRTISSEGDLAAIYAAIEQTIETFDRHRRTNPLRAALRALGQSPRPVVMKWMHDEQHPAHLVLRGLIKRGDTPGAGASKSSIVSSTTAGIGSGMDSCAWVWLKLPALAPACVERLSKLAGDDSQAGSTSVPSPGLHLVLKRIHLLANPARAEAVKDSSRLGPNGFASAVPTGQQVSAFEPDARVGLAKWIFSVSLPERLRDAGSAVVLSDPLPAVRHSLVRAAVTGGAKRTPSCLLDLIFDADKRVAISAAQAILAVSSKHHFQRDMHTRLIELLGRSPVPSLRALAQQATQKNPQNQHASQARGAQILGFNPAGIASGLCTSRTTDLAIAERLERFLHRGQGSPRQAASDVKSLARSPIAGVEELLVRATGADDVRVRANAVEAAVARTRLPVPLASSDRYSNTNFTQESHARNVTSDVRVSSSDALSTHPLTNVLIDNATDKHHRVRANAARGLILLGQFMESAQGDAIAQAGSRTLSLLLSDARTMHRVAGLWLVERVAATATMPLQTSSSMLPVSDLLDRTKSIMAESIDPLERWRASRAHQRLEQLTREQWAQGAATLQVEAKQVESSEAAA